MRLTSTSCCLGPPDARRRASRRSIALSACRGHGTRGSDGIGPASSQRRRWSLSCHGAARSRGAVSIPARVPGSGPRDPPAPAPLQRDRDALACTFMPGLAGRLCSAQLGAPGITPSRPPAGYSTGSPDQARRTQMWRSVFGPARRSGLGMRVMARRCRSADRMRQAGRARAAVACRRSCAADGPRA